MIVISTNNKDEKNIVFRLYVKALCAHLGLQAIKTQIDIARLNIQHVISNSEQYVVAGDFNLTSLSDNSKKIHIIEILEKISNSVPKDNNMLVSNMKKLIAEVEPAIDMGDLPNPDLLELLFQAKEIEADLKCFVYSSSESKVNKWKPVFDYLIKKSNGFLCVSNRIMQAFKNVKEAAEDEKTQSESLTTSEGSTSPSNSPRVSPGGHYSGHDDHKLKSYVKSYVRRLLIISAEKYCSKKRPVHQSNALNK